MSLAILSCLLLLVFTYLGYPAWLWLWRRLHPQTVARAPILVPVSVLLSVFNEASRVAARLENLAQQDYPVALLEIVVVCDGATDGTLDALQQVQQQWAKRQDRPLLTLLSLAQNGGKPAALSRAVSCARGEILVFADARQVFEQDVITRLLENFADPSVGAVSGQLKFRDTGGEAHMGAYWALEQRVRQWQSDSGSVMGVSGAIYAMRALLYTPLPDNTLVDDLLQPLRVMKTGYRVVLDPRALAWDEPPAADSHEMRRKVRTLTGVWQCLVPALSLLRAGRPGLVLRFMAHKFLRLLMPWVLVLLPLLCVASGVTGWQVFAGVLVAGVMLVLLADRLTILQRLPLMGTARVFLLLNVAAARSLFHFVRGDGQALWTGSNKEGRP